MSTCKDCIHKKACFGPEEVDDKGSIFMLSNAEKDCVSFEHVDNFQQGGVLFPLNMRLYDKYYSKPRCWKIRAIDISIVRDKPRVALYIYSALRTLRVREIFP